MEDYQGLSRNQQENLEKAIGWIVVLGGVFVAGSLVVALFK